MKIGNKEFECVSIQVEKSTLERIRKESKDAKMTLSEWFHLKLKNDKMSLTLNKDIDVEGLHGKIDELKEELDMVKKKQSTSTSPAIKKSVNEIKEVVSSNNSHVLELIEELEGSCKIQFNEIQGKIEFANKIKPLELWDRLHAVETKASKSTRFKEMIDDNQKQIMELHPELGRIKISIADLKERVASMHKDSHAQQLQIENLQVENRKRSRRWWNLRDWL